MLGSTLLFLEKDPRMWSSNEATKICKRDDVLQITMNFIV